MKLATYRRGTGEGRLGVLQGDLVIDIEKFGSSVGIPLPSTMLDFIDLGFHTVEVLEDILRTIDKKHLVGTALHLDNVKLLAPIPAPRKNIFGIGLNYTEHIAESARSLDTEIELPQKCVIFSKPTSAVIGHGDGIRHNSRLTQQLDWEGELAVVMGRRACRVDKKNALAYVFGYTIINDISARDCRRSGQWIVSKGQDTFAPMGPLLVTHDEIEDPHNLRISTKVNGVEKQSSNTRFMLFNVPAIIEDISEGMTLNPGDIIATGTPSGVGAGRDPQEWMWPGDVVEVTIEKIGTLRNHVIKG